MRAFVKRYFICVYKGIILFLFSQYFIYIFFGILMHFVIYTKNFANNFSILPNDL